MPAEVTQTPFVSLNQCIGGLRQRPPLTRVIWLLYSARLKGVWRAKPVRLRRSRHNSGDHRLSKDSV